MSAPAIVSRGTFNDADYFHEKSGRALWCEVLHEQVKLALSVRINDTDYEKWSARRWFGSRDFYAVCALAGLDGNWILKGFQARLADRQVAQ